MPAPNDDGLPPDWKPADLEKTVKSDFGIGSDDGLPQRTRFLKNVALLVRRRLAKGGEDKDLAIFLLSPTVPEAFEKNCKHVPMLDNALTQVTGSYWFVTEVAAAGHSLQIPQGLDDEGVFKIVTDDVKLGGTQAIVLDTRTEPPTVRHYPEGIAKPNIRDTIDLSGSPVTLNEIFASMDRTHRDGLVTPLVQGKGGMLWKDSAKYYPISDAESKIQYVLKIGLANAFPTCTVREEQGMPVGRLDLEIEEADALDRTKITRHAVIELKVLRSFYASGISVSAKKIKDWVSDGVIQASEYRINRGAVAAALCCFDMRKEDTKEACFAHVQKTAKEKAVTLRRWHLYNDPKSYRAALAA